MPNQDDLSNVQQFVTTLLRDLGSPPGDDARKREILVNGITSLSLTVKVRDVEVSLYLSSGASGPKPGQRGGDPGIDLHIQPGGSCTTGP